MITRDRLRNIYVLSIVSAILLPMTLVIGLSGISLGGMPWLAAGGGFWIALLITLGTANRRPPHPALAAPVLMGKRPVDDILCAKAPP